MQTGLFLWNRVVTRWNGARGSARTAPCARAENDPERPYSTRVGWSATQTQSVDQQAVALDINLGHVLEQPPPATHQQQ